MNEENIKLETVSAVNAVELFSPGGVDRLLGALEVEVRGVVCDVSTPKGRKDLASLAYKVNRSKITLDGFGEKLIAEWKTKSKAVDAERKKIRGRLDALKTEVRKPLTEWEDADNTRIEKEQMQKRINEAHERAIFDNDLFDRQKAIERREEEQRQALVEKKEREEEKRA